MGSKNREKESRPELIERAVDDHIKGIEREDIDLVERPQEIEYLRLKSDLIILQSEENARLQFKLLQEKTKDIQGDPNPLIKESTPHYLKIDSRRDN